MESTLNTAVPATHRIHPLMAIAAVSVIAASATGVAAMFGVLPHTSASVVSQEALVAQSAAQFSAQSIQTPAAAAARTAAQVTDGVVTVPARKHTVKVAQAPREATPAEPRYEARNEPRDTGVARVPVQEPAPIQAEPQRSAEAPRQSCYDCGVIESVNEVERAGDGTGLGAVGGAIAGGALGNTMGRGRGNLAMSVLGAVGGAIAGHQVEKKVRASKSYEITVRFDDGSIRTVSQSTPPAWRAGDKVRVDGGSIQPRE